MARQRIGARRHVADAQKHNGNVDDHNQPTYTTATDWETVVESWPCEILTTMGGERLRGRQVAENTTHVFFGEFYGGQAITPEMRLVSGGNIYNVTSAYDPEGDHREMRVEARREN